MAFYGETTPGSDLSIYANKLFGTTGADSVLSYKSPTLDKNTYAQPNRTNIRQVLAIIGFNPQMRDIQKVPTLPNLTPVRDEKLIEEGMGVKPDMAESLASQGLLVPHLHALGFEEDMYRSMFYRPLYGKAKHALVGPMKMLAAISGVSMEGFEANTSFTQELVSNGLFFDYGEEYFGTVLTPKLVEEELKALTRVANNHFYGAGTLMGQLNRFKKVAAAATPGFDRDAEKFYTHNLSINLIDEKMPTAPDPHIDLTEDRPYLTVLAERGYMYMNLKSASGPWFLTDDGKTRPNSEVQYEVMILAQKLFDDMALDFQDMKQKWPGFNSCLMKPKAEVYEISNYLGKTRNIYVFNAHLNLLFVQTNKWLHYATISTLDDPDSISLYGFSPVHGQLDALLSDMVERAKILDSGSAWADASNVIGVYSDNLYIATALPYDIEGVGEKGDVAFISTDGVKMEATATENRVRWYYATLLAIYINRKFSLQIKPKHLIDAALLPSERDSSPLAKLFFHPKEESMGRGSRPTNLFLVCRLMLNVMPRASINPKAFLGDALFSVVGQGSGSGGTTPVNFAGMFAAMHDANEMVLFDFANLDERGYPRFTDSFIQHQKERGVSLTVERMQVFTSERGVLQPRQTGHFGMMRLDLLGYDAIFDNARKRALPHLDIERMRKAILFLKHEAAGETQKERQVAGEINAVMKYLSLFLAGGAIHPIYSKVLLALILSTRQSLKKVSLNDPQVVNTVVSNILLQGADEAGVEPPEDAAVARYVAFITSQTLPSVDLYYTLATGEGEVDPTVATFLQTYVPAGMPEVAVTAGQRTINQAFMQDTKKDKEPHRKAKDVTIRNIKGTDEFFERLAKIAETGLNNEAKKQAATNKVYAELKEGGFVLPKGTKLADLVVVVTGHEARVKEIFEKANVKYVEVNEEKANKLRNFVVTQLKLKLKEFYGTEGAGQNVGTVVQTVERTREEKVKELKEEKKIKDAKKELAPEGGQVLREFAAGFAKGELRADLLGHLLRSYIKGENFTSFTNLRKKYADLGTDVIMARLIEDKVLVPRRVQQDKPP